MTTAPASHAIPACRASRRSREVNSAASSSPTIQNWATPASGAPSLRRSGTQASISGSSVARASAGAGAPASVCNFSRARMRANGRVVHSSAEGGSSESSNGKAPLNRRPASKTRIAKTPRYFEALSTAASNSPGASVNPTSARASAPFANCIEATAASVSALPDKICSRRPPRSCSVTNANTAAKTATVRPTTVNCVARPGGDGLAGTVMKKSRPHFSQFQRIPSKPSFR